ncbi:MAG: flagellar biosynthesis protein FlhB [Thermaerobacterales bacterium]
MRQERAWWAALQFGNPLRGTMVRPIHLQLFADDDGEKQEPATPKRRRESRERGEVFRSSELSSAVILLGGLLTLWFGGSRAGEALSLLFDQAYGQWMVVDWEAADIFHWAEIAGGVWLTVTGPVIAALVVVGVGVNLAQVGPLFTAQPLSPKFERINPISGAKRVFSRRALFEFAKAMIRLTVVLGVTYRGARIAAEELQHLAGGAVTIQVAVIGQHVLWIALQASFAILVLAVFDFMYQRYEHEKKMMMTRKQVKDEFKQNEGDPQVRSQVRKRQRELSRNRMLAEVAQSDVIITNPTHFAVALKYRPEKMEAPVVVAKGTDYLALQIRRLAKEHGVVRVEQPFLARSLYREVEVGEAVPETLFEAVAEVIAFVWRLQGRRFTE